MRPASGPAARRGVNVGAVTKRCPRVSGLTKHAPGLRDRRWHGLALIFWNRGLGEKRRHRVAKGIRRPAPSRHRRARRPAAELRHPRPSIPRCSRSAWLGSVGRYVAARKTRHDLTKAPPVLLSGDEPSGRGVSARETPLSRLGPLAIRRPMMTSSSVSSYDPPARRRPATTCRAAPSQGCPRSRKLEEEAVETVIAALGDDAPKRSPPKPPTAVPPLACSTQKVSRSPSPRQPSSAAKASRAWRKGGRTPDADDATLP